MAKMTRAYSLDLRERVVSRVASGEPVRSVAALFDISVSCVVKWSLRYRATGSVAPGKIGGHKRVILSAHRDWILARIEEPNLTLRGLKAELAERGVSVSYGALWNFVHAHGKSFKKNRAAVRTKPRAHSAAARSMEEVSKPD